MQEALFNANLNALKNPLLKQELLSIKIAQKLNLLRLDPHNAGQKHRA